MIKKIAIFIAFLPLFVFAQDRIMVIADPHVLASSLVESGSAMDDMMAGQRKMLDISEAAFLATIDTALFYQPALVLIPGDLTKDSEKASHDVVVAQLNRLKVAGINALVIPGNHDIGGKSYAYYGGEKVAVEGLIDEDWESQYAMVYDQAVAKDIDSHSYAVEPLPGVTIIGIDASHDAGEGYLSDGTLTWVTAQADSARAKGNMVIAMCHWQVLEHVDKGGVMMESGCLIDADILRDSLMAHDVHVLLTGHVHINSITTFRDTLNNSGDSIVEISTGSPITYPCPYRWLTLSQDRSTVTVDTEQLTSLPDYPMLTSYSRTWMSDHIRVMLPALSVRFFDHAQEVLEDYVKKNVPMASNTVLQILKQAMPQTDEEKLAMVDKHLTPTITELYLLHSDANEPSHPEADSLAQALYDGVSDMIHDLTDKVLKYYASVQKSMIKAVQQSLKEPIQSLVEDRTHWASNYYSDVTDDLQVILKVQAPQQPTSITHTREEWIDNATYDLMGRRIADYEKCHPGIYIQNGKKIIRN